MKRLLVSVFVCYALSFHAYAAQPPHKKYDHSCVANYSLPGGEFQSGKCSAVKALFEGMNKKEIVKHFQTCLVSNVTDLKQCDVSQKDVPCAKAIELITQAQSKASKD